MVDENANKESRALLANLFRLSEEYVLFGHQDDLAYGVKWIAEPGRSDVKEVTGAYPAVSGWEIGGLGLGKETNLDNVKFDNIQQWIKQVYRRGGVNTISWHMYDPVTGGGAWTQEPVVSRILPGGDGHEKFKAYLDAFAVFNEGLKVTNDDGETVHVPVIFRPWHEHTGDWFWWGKGHTSEEEYIALWRFTVEYLRDHHGAHNLIYAYSPDRSRIDMADFREGYLYAYPGDEYVDILGLDNYWDLGHPVNEASRQEQQRNLQRSLESLAQIAAEKDKVPAMTEGGQETLYESNFWTDRVLKALTASADARRIAYLLVWRNAHPSDKPDHFYVPYPGHESEDDFIQFYKHPLTLFEDGLPDMYTLPD